MHYRAKELNKRSAFPLNEVGKRKIDAWSHDRVYVNRDKTYSLADFLSPYKIIPFDYCIANDRLDRLVSPPYGPS
jgi:hypothetical protein